MQLSGVSLGSGRAYHRGYFSASPPSLKKTQFLLGRDKYVMMTMSLTVLEKITVVILNVTCLIVSQFFYGPGIP